MIVQAIGLLDDLDKELNTYAMRVREWYGWHFPEMTRVVTDNIQYALAVRFQGVPTALPCPCHACGHCHLLYTRLAAWRLILFKFPSRVAFQSAQQTCV